MTKMNDHTTQIIKQEVITEQYCDELKSIMTESNHSIQTFTQEVIPEQFCDELKTIDKSDTSVHMIKQEIKTEQNELTLTEKYGGFVCPECSEHFYSDKSFVEHVRERHTIYPLCEVYDNNEIGLKTDPGNPMENCKENICPICWERFLDDNNFDQHIREHYNMKCARQNSSQLTSNINMIYSPDQNENSRTRQMENINGHSFLNKEIPSLGAFTNLTESPPPDGKKHQAENDDDHSTDSDYIPEPDSDYIPDSDSDYIPDAEPDSDYIADSDSDYIPEPQMINSYRSRPFRCEFCSSAFTQKGNQLRHQRIHTGEKVEKPYKCKICSFAAIDKSNLTLHQRIHTGEKPFKCEFCSSAFSRKHHLQLHQRRNNTGERKRPFKCEVRSVQRSELEQHKRIHTGEKPFKCEFCSSAFAWKSHLQRHLVKHTVKVKHTVDKPHKCDSCPAAFSTKGSLTRHNKSVHIGVKPFKCELCPAAFSQRGNLMNHQRTHTGEKPFKCKVCTAAFIQISGLNNHQRKHTEDRRFKCDICPSAFSQTSFLITHKQDHHSGNTSLRQHTKPFKCEIEHDLLLLKGQVQSNID
ncbi:zinc finger protein 260-like [Bolinopsis microptera]|uniref:zinc finger protein 260-like n=1 Tax=Bolinopsis microptera TaxID=2820187 RepID=UPI003078B9DC